MSWRSSTASQNMVSPVHLQKAVSSNVPTNCTAAKLSHRSIAVADWTMNIKETTITRAPSIMRKELLNQLKNGWAFEDETSLGLVNKQQQTYFESSHFQFFVFLLAIEIALIIVLLRLLSLLKCSFFTILLPTWRAPVTKSSAVKTDTMPKKSR